MQVYLPQALYEAVKAHGLSASALLQEAVRTEIRSRELLAASQKYTADLTAETGMPLARQRARAAAAVRRIAARFEGQAG